MSLKQLTIIVFSFLFFFASTGVLVFHHHCMEQGHFANIFVPVNHDCEEEVDEKTCSASNCCTDEVNSSETDAFFSETQCCNDAIDFVVIDSELNTHEADEQIINLLPTTTPVIEFALVFIKETKNLDYKDPPYFSKTSDQLSIIQTYLI